MSLNVLNFLIILKVALVNYKDQCMEPAYTLDCTPSLHFILRSLGCFIRWKKQRYILLNHKNSSCGNWMLKANDKWQMLLKSTCFISKSRSNSFLRLIKMYPETHFQPMHHSCPLVRGQSLLKRYFFLSYWGAWRGLSFFPFLFL